MVLNLGLLIRHRRSSPIPRMLSHLWLWICSCCDYSRLSANIWVSPHGGREKHIEALGGDGAIGPLRYLLLVAPNTCFESLISKILIGGSLLWVELSIECVFSFSWPAAIRCSSHSLNYEMRGVYYDNKPIGPPRREQLLCTVQFSLREFSFTHMRAQRTFARVHTTLGSSASDNHVLVCTLYGSTKICLISKYESIQMQIGPIFEL